MDELDLILRFVSGGGDVATAFIAWAIWKLDRRVLVLELMMKGKEHEELV